MEWAARRIRQRISLPSAVLLSIAMLVISFLVMGLNQMVRGVSVPALLGCGFIGVLISWGWLSKIKHAWIAFLLVLLSGVLFSLFFVGEVGSAILSWGGDVTRVVPDLLSERYQEGLAQLQQATVRLSFILSIVFDTVSSWWRDLLADRAGYNQQVTVLIWNYVIWVMAGWLGWAVRRGWNPFGAIIPVVGLMTAVVAYIKADSWTLSLVMVVCFMLVAFIQHFLRERQWEANGISYSLELRYDVLGVTLLISFIIIVLTLVTPSLSIRKLVQSVQEIVEKGEAVDLAPAVGLYEKAEGPYGGAGQRAGVLPASQLVGNPPELGEEIVMHVRASDAFLTEVAERPYWRSHTYEEYTGSGWLVGEVLLESKQPGEKLAAGPAENSGTYWFDFAVFDNVNIRLYHPGQLITADQEYGAIYRVSPEGGREEKDLFAGLMEFKFYRVEAAWPAYSVEAMGSASSDTPAWVLARYLQLPRNLPPRVRDLAEQITKDAQSSYQQAAAIETYLRNYTYNLSVPPPPEGQDIVDYFLFDLQEGYCDYYATAMVVLARTVRLPARLVTGYSTGTYLPDGGYYEVTEANAHSWVEVYFSEFGWVEFEPTSGRTQFDRDDADAVVQPAFSFPSRTGTLWKKVIPWLAYGAAAMGFVVSMSLGIDLHRLRSGSAERMAKVVYQRMIWFAKKSRVPYLPSLTPFEFSTLFRDSLQKLWGQSGLTAKLNLRNQHRLDYFTRQCVLAVYGGKKAGYEAKGAMSAAWIRLFPWLVISQVRSWFQRSSTQEPVPE